MEKNSCKKCEHFRIIYGSRGVEKICKKNGLVVEFENDWTCDMYEEEDKNPMVYVSKTEKREDKIYVELTTERYNSRLNGIIVSLNEKNSLEVRIGQTQKLSYFKTLE